MREILYRAKAINRDSGYHRTNYKNGDFVYGLVTRLYDERFENLPAVMTDTYGISGIEVDYSTIGQYTGLTDKNGTRIFEGDILKYINEDNEPHYITVVFEDCAFLIDDCGFLDPDLLTSYVCLGLEVVGNIFENPELASGV